MQSLNKGLFLFLKTIPLYIYNRYIIIYKVLKKGNAWSELTEQFILILENMGYIEDLEKYVRYYR